MFWVQNVTWICSVSTPPPSGRFGYYVLRIMEVPSREGDTRTTGGFGVRVSKCKQDVVLSK